MANEEQLAILRQGVEVWNKWRKEQPYLTKYDLSGADLIQVNLKGASFADVDFTGADLSGAQLDNSYLSGACFTEAKLSRAILFRAFLREASFIRSDSRGAKFSETNSSYVDFSGSQLDEADLSDADFTVANLSGTSIKVGQLMRSNFMGAKFNGAVLIDAYLDFANFTAANLNDADLTGATLLSANLKSAKLQNVKFNKTVIGDTIFGEGDLSQIESAEYADHREPSTVGLDAIAFSKGKIPESFLRGCGLSDLEIEYSKLYNPDLSNEEINKIVYKIYDLRATQALQISPLFISYSHGDSVFVNRLENGLNKTGVRFWRDIHDATVGRLETQIDRAIRQNPTVLLVLSKNSIKSDWVEHEVRKARELEKELGRDALCPIALDDGWKSSPWPKRVMEQVMEYNILDFSDWEDKSAFEGKFAKLLNGLDLFYKKAGSI